MTVVLDCGGADADVDPELLKHLTIISPNESELANLTGVTTASLSLCNSLQLSIVCLSKITFEQAESHEGPAFLFED